MAPILASMEASSDYTALGILPQPLPGNETSYRTSHAKVDHSKNSNSCFILELKVDYHQRYAKQNGQEIEKELFSVDST